MTGLTPDRYQPHTKGPLMTSYLNDIGHWERIADSANSTVADAEKLNIPVIAQDVCRALIDLHNALAEQQEVADPLNDPLAAPESYPIPSARDGWHQIYCPWCGWYTTGFEPACKEAWHAHKAEKHSQEKPEPDPLDEDDHPPLED